MSDRDDPSELSARLLLETGVLAIRDVQCRGTCQHKSPAECAPTTQLVYPYRGAFMHHVGRTDTIAEVNQLIFFNEAQDYAVSHPVSGGDACLSIAIEQELLRELTPADQLEAVSRVEFRQVRRRIDPRAQALVALLRHGLDRGAIDVLEAETLALALVRRSLGERTSHMCKATYGREKLVGRTKLLLAADPGRRWTLGAIAREVGVSPVYLTQTFAQAEGVPLYRYQLQLRLARALDLIAEVDDLTMLALDLGFSSHSHFTSAFRRLYGRAPAEFQRATGLR